MSVSPPPRRCGILGRMRILLKWLLSAVSNAFEY